MVTEQMRKMGLTQTWGVTLTAQTKTDIVENLHRMLAEGRLRLVYDQELIAEMNSERYEMTKTGQLLFSHSSGTHDDMLWALALACHGLRYSVNVTEYHPVAMTGKIIKSRLPTPSPVRPGPAWIIRY